MFKISSLVYLAWSFTILPLDIALKFPPNFFFGASSSAYQSEGAWNAYGKGESIWDRFAHTHPDAIDDGENGDIADNSYNLFQKDVELFKSIGLNAFRFSISWSRILPNGQRTTNNSAGIAHYNDLIDELLKNDIEPVVTMYHWDLPQKLQDYMGGWVNSSIIDYVEDYADLLFSTYGDRVKWWLTMNEPIHAIQGYYSSGFAPGLNLGTPYDYITAHNLLLAHARVFRLYDKKYRSKQNGNVSIALSYDFYAPKTSKKSDIEATERCFQFMVGLFAHPIYSKEGDYPELVRKIVDENSKREGRNKSRLQYFTKKEKQELLGSSDYFAINHYTTYLISSSSSQFNSTDESVIPFGQDIKMKVDTVPFAPNTKKTRFKVVPWGLRDALVRIKTDYNNPPIVVTENGYNDDGQLNDTKRISFYQAYLTQLLGAVYNHSCNVLGYLTWSALDDFEWSSGYSLKFGLIHVDFNSPRRTRTLKSSAYFYKSLIENKTIPDPK